ncbi:hypothetical protein AQ616_02030 [Oceanobacillus sp. E9]|uniref:PepSY domain-containing protein n=1 Tax=Oceanobacillus kimchii TaxID=746691 RepID=A0ABQ5TQ85_9BACI|nr:MULTISPECIES: PepSY domain-containing protein [Oceanobacillus]MBT2599776.1 PepSY domain-containing protein [Oceanobacillus sp. ISL-74]OEH56320.1 hypothetical protein AQ616_02030 [Oceanobacillus sp. E9]GLO68006.1 hypothetical protein MACH08_37900 [Oceanobacillus kimchii]
MKNKILIGTVAGTVMFGGAAIVGASDNNENAEISAEQALQTALENTEGFVQEVDLSFEDDENYYEIEIESNDKDYEFYVDATTGEVLGQEPDSDVENEEQKEDGQNNPGNNHYPNEPTNLSSFEEYNTITDQVNTDNLTFHLETDNQGNRIMFLVDEDGTKHYKTIFIKHTSHLKIIDLNGGGQIFYEQI